MKVNIANPNEDKTIEIDALRVFVSHSSEKVDKKMAAKVAKMYGIVLIATTWNVEFEMYSISVSNAVPLLCVRSLFAIAKEVAVTAGAMIIKQSNAQTIKKNVNDINQVCTSFKASNI